MLAKCRAVWYHGSLTATEEILVFNKLKMCVVLYQLVDTLSRHWRGWFQLEKWNPNSLKCEVVSNSFWRISMLHYAHIVE